MLRWFSYSVVIFGIGALVILVVELVRHKDLSETRSTLLSVATLCTLGGVGLLLLLHELPIRFVGP